MGRQKHTLATLSITLQFQGPAGVGTTSLRWDGIGHEPDFQNHGGPVAMVSLLAPVAAYLEEAAAEAEAKHAARMKEIAEGQR
jgi:hypothetical protein